MALRVGLTLSPHLNEWPLIALTGRLVSTLTGHSRSRPWTQSEPCEGDRADDGNASAPHFAWVNLL
jgi:hypothetical protein